VDIQERNRTRRTGVMCDGGSDDWPGIALGQAGLGLVQTHLKMRNLLLEGRFVGNGR